MKRTLLLLLLVAVVVLAACSDPGDVAATINGHDIAASEVTRGAHGFGQSQLFSQQLSQQGVDLRPDGPVPTAFAAQWLVSLIQTQAIQQIAAKRHVTASDQEVAQAKQQFTGSSQNAVAFRQLPKWLQDEIVQTTALQLALGSSLKPAVSQTKLQQAYQQLESDCASKKLIGHILVATPQAAQDVIDRVHGGESFASVAASASTDTGSSSQGGLLTCEGSSQWSQLDATFRAGAEATPVGQISQPIQTQFGYHVIEALPLTPDTAQPLVLAALQAQNPLDAVIGKYLQRAKITVNPRFGTLQRQGGSFTINPPSPKRVRSLPGTPSSTSSTTAPASP
jgi:parvulin-like peptidyl-prolyl isomerase